MTWARVKPQSWTEAIGKAPIEWWLIFHDPVTPRWWNRWLKPGFRHVSALRRDGRIWVHVVPTVAFIDVNVLRTDAHPWQIFKDATCVRVVSYRDLSEYRTPMLINAITCVEIMKGLLGIRRFTVWTPYQLYKYCNTGVLRHG